VIGEQSTQEMVCDLGKWFSFICKAHWHFCQRVSFLSPCCKSVHHQNEFNANTVTWMSSNQY